MNKRRRILRRGLPYGEHDPGNPSDDGEHGNIFMAICANLFRRFEFVQQQWIQSGLDFDPPYTNLRGLRLTGGIPKGAKH